MEDCLFCKIIKGDIPSTKVYEDELVYAFRDINPRAPVHVLIVPKKHISTLNDLQPDDELLMGHIALTTKKIAELEGIAESGYRTIFNCGKDGRQMVMHIHCHVLGGKLLHE
jgi:histidine triad (HIT) family protein